MNQKPENPFAPGDRVVKAGDDEASTAVVVEVLPPETEVSLYGQTVDGEAVRVAFPDSLDAGPSDWREIHPAKLASYCDDQEIKRYTYKHTNIEYPDNPFVPGDYVIKPDDDDPDLARVVSVDETDTNDRSVTVVFCKHLREEAGGGSDVPPETLESHCEDAGISTYAYCHSDLQFDRQY